MERITHTRLCSWQIVLADGRPLAVSARRQPMTDEVLWFVFAAEGGPSLSAGPQLKRAIARLAAESGLDGPWAGTVRVRLIGPPRSGGTAGGAG